MAVSLGDELMWHVVRRRPVKAPWRMRASPRGLVHDGAAGHAGAVVGKPGQRGLLDELVRVLVHRLDAGGLQFVARAGADLGHQHRVAVVDGIDDRRQLLVFAIAALAVQVDPAVADEQRLARLTS
jgi:hypothetical protein